MMIKLFFRIICALFFIFNSFAYGNDNKTNRIEVLVNESIITKYDIIQRMKINSILNRIEINDDNYNQLLTAVIDDLVVEKLKNKKIDEYNIRLEKSEFKSQENRFFSNFDFNKEELKELFSLNNVNYNYLIDFLEVEFKWQKLIYGLYLRVTSVTEKEISDLIDKNPNITKETAKEIILQKQIDIKSRKLIKDLRNEATIEYK